MVAHYCGRIKVKSAGPRFNPRWGQGARRFTFALAQSNCSVRPGFKWFT